MSLLAAGSVEADIHALSSVVQMPSGDLWDLSWIPNPQKPK